jgi:hypothetical protein
LARYAVVLDWQTFTFAKVFIFKYLATMLHRVWSILLALPFWAFGQTANIPVTLKSKVAVLHIDSKGFILDPAQMGNLVRLELDKLGQFEVLDKYDVAYLAEKENLNFDKCFGKICLVETGRKLRADKMLTGSVELLGEHVVVTLRLIDVGTESIEKSHVAEFLNLRAQVHLMIEISLRQMLGLPTEADVVTKLTKPDDYASTINLPDVARLNLSGPRMGLTVFSGDAARWFAAPRQEGGLDVKPVMFQFGYQFETSYLNQGGLQALFEFIPLITGLDQSQIIPSISILHGIRSNRNGFEFAFGPSIVLTKEAEGFYSDGKWNLLSEWKASNPNLSAPAATVLRFDSRGTPKAASSFVFAFGKSFKSGNLNIPVNAFFIPNKTGHRFGVSVGFNGRGK